MATVKEGGPGTSVSEGTAGLDYRRIRETEESRGNREKPGTDGTPQEALVLKVERCWLSAAACALT